MKKTKVVSVLTILACLFMLIAGALGMSDVMEQKDVKTQEGAEARQQLDTLAAGIEELESNRQTYNEGKQTYEKGLAQYNAGLAKYKASLKEYTEGLATLKSKTADYEKGKITYANGVKEYNAGLSKYNSSLQQYENGKKALAAGRKEFASKESLLAGVERLQNTYKALTHHYTKDQAAAFVAESSGKSKDDVLYAYDTINGLKAGYSVDDASEMVGKKAGKKPEEVKAAYENVSAILACRNDEAKSIQLAAQNSGVSEEIVGKAYNGVKKLYTGYTVEEAAEAVAKKIDNPMMPANSVKSIYNSVNEKILSGTAPEDAYKEVSASSLGTVSPDQVRQIYENMSAILACKGDEAKSIHLAAQSSGASDDDVRAAYNGVKKLYTGYKLEEAAEAVAEAANGANPDSTTAKQVESAYTAVATILACKGNEANSIKFVAANGGYEEKTIQNLYNTMNMLQQPDGFTKEQAYGVIKASQPDLTDADIDTALATDVPAMKGKLEEARNTINASQATLDAAKPQLASAKEQLNAAESKLANGKAQLEEYESGKATLDAAKPQLEAAKKQLAEAKKALEEGLAKLKTFEDGEKQVEAGKATLTAIAEVQAKVDAGLDVVKAGYEYLDESTVSTTKDLTGKAVANILALLAGVLGIIAGILGLSGKKATRVLATLAVLAAAAALIFALIKDPITAVLIAAILGTVMTLALTLVAKPASVNGAPEENTDTENN